MLSSEYRPGVFSDNTTGGWSGLDNEVKLSVECCPSTQTNGAITSSNYANTFRRVYSSSPGSTKRMEGENFGKLKRPSYYVSVCSDRDGAKYNDNYVKFEIPSRAVLEDDGE